MSWPLLEYTYIVWYYIICRRLFAPEPKRRLSFPGRFILFIRPKIKTPHVKIYIYQTSSCCWKMSSFKRDIWPLKRSALHAPKIGERASGTPGVLESSWWLRTASPPDRPNFSRHLYGAKKNPLLLLYNAIHNNYSKKRKKNNTQ